MIRINNKTYHIKDWDSLTIDEAQKLTEIEIPGKMLKLYQSKTPKEFEDFQKELTLQDEIIFGEYAGRVLKIMSDIPDELIEYMQYYDRNDLYEYHCRDKILSLINGTPIYEPKGIESFQFEGERFLMPNGLKILDKYLPNHSEKAISFIEGQAIFKAYFETKETGNISMLIAIYCRPKGEKYDEGRVLERAEKFKKLTMDIAWEVFFYISGQLNILTKTINTSLLQTLTRKSVLKS